MTDRCTHGHGLDLPEDVCDETVAKYGTPRIGVGMPLADETLDCKLKPVPCDDYNVTFTDDQCKRLQAAFPDGGVRLQSDGPAPARRDRVADLPGRQRKRDLRRAGAGKRAVEHAGGHRAGEGEEENAHKGPPSQGPGAGAAPRSVAGAGAG